ncbi:MAG: hypothetical protein Q7K57_55790 [Burkholderiaceae bacterium]|nr:hypothetical protein [Burkholderiaceae bacterium]
MKIRLAQAQDLEAIVFLGEKMCAESRFRVFPMNLAKTRESVRKIISNPLAGCILLAEHPRAGLVGMLAGYVVDYFFSDALVAQDSYFYVAPEHRGSAAALKLLIAFRRWAENRNASELCINMSVDIEPERFNRFMRHMNFQSCGSNFFLPLQQPPQHEPSRTLTSALH